jgi:hypothetical protein
MEDKMHICINCGSEFKEWIFVYKCQNCDDGITDNVRDIDFDGSGYCKCHVCKGTGEEEILETYCCCEYCMDEHIEKVTGP